MNIGNVAAHEKTDTFFTSTQYILHAVCLYEKDSFPPIQGNLLGFLQASTESPLLSHVT